MASHVNSTKHLNVYLFIFERETREHKQGGQRERGRDRVPSRLHTVHTEPDAGLQLMNCEIMTCAEIKSQPLNQLSHSGTPSKHLKLS